jgi:hypothetical protein
MESSSLKEPYPPKENSLLSTALFFRSKRNLFLRFPGQYTVQKIEGFLSNANKGVNVALSSLFNPYAKSNKPMNKKGNATPNLTPEAVSDAPVVTPNTLPPSTANGTSIQAIPNTHNAVVSPDIDHDRCSQGINQPNETPTRTQSPNTPTKTANTNQPNNSIVPSTNVNGGAMETATAVRNGNITTRFSQIEIRLCMHPSETETGDINQL